MCLLRPTFADPRGHHPQGVMGKKHFERGLMWVETYQAGHMQPYVLFPLAFLYAFLNFCLRQYQPAATWQHLQWVLGRIDDL
jgi:carboxypeptidase D